MGTVSLLPAIGWTSGAATAVLAIGHAPPLTAALRFVEKQRGAAEHHVSCVVRPALDVHRRTRSAM